MKSRLFGALAILLLLVIALSVLAMPHTASAAIPYDDTNWPTYPGYDLVVGGVWSRQAVSDYMWRFDDRGFDQNFAWYSNDTVIQSGSWDNRVWSSLGQDNGYSWYSEGYWWTPLKTLFYYSPATFRAWEYNGTFVAKVCGNTTWSASNPAPPRVSGYRWNDLNRNGAWDSGEPTLAGTVALYKGGSFLGRYAAGSNGYYEFILNANAGYRPGTYEVRADPIVGWTPTYGGSRWINVVEGSSSAGRNYANNNFGDRILTYSIVPSAGPGGSIAPSSTQTVNYGSDSASFVMTPSVGYHLADVSVDGVSVGTPGTYKFSAVTANHTVTANFAINTYTLTYIAGPGGAIDGVTPQTVNHGADGAPVTAQPNTGYHFVSWSDGKTDATRTDLDVTADKTVTANFAINTYTLTYLAGPGGAIVGPTPQTVNYGADGAAVVAQPTTGYHFVNWSDGSTTANRTDLDVTRNITVTANFAEDPLVAKGWMTGGGDLVSQGSGNVTYGFELHGLNGSSNNLEINWGGNSFHMETLTSFACFLDPAISAGKPAAGFNTCSGTGSGRFNGVDGYTVSFTFADAGEPGTHDAARIVIRDGAGDVVLTADAVLTGGNNQAHSSNAVSTGTNVSVQTGEVAVTFQNVTVEGTLTLTPNAPKHSAPANFRMVPNIYLDIHPTASFMGLATVTIPIPEAYDGDLMNLKVLHWANGGWEKIDSVVDLVNRTVTFQTASFSEFTLGEPVEVGPPAPTGAASFSAEYPFGPLNRAPSRGSVTVFSASKIDSRNALVTVDGVPCKALVDSDVNVSGAWSVVESWNAEKGIWTSRWTWVAHAPDASFTRLVFFPSGAATSDGLHTVAVTIKDINGVSSTDTWDYLIQAAPIFGDASPMANSRVGVTAPVIRVPVSDNSGVAACSATANGKPLPATYADGAVVVSGFVAESDGPVLVTVAATDASGNIANITWSFNMSVFTNLTCTTASCHGMAPLAEPFMGPDCLSCHAGTRAPSAGSHPGMTFE